MSTAHDARHRILNHPAQATFEDLLAVLLSHGQSGCDVYQLGRELARVAGDEGGLYHLEPQAILGIKGIGRARAAMVMAAVELSRRQHGGVPVAQGAFDPAGVARLLFARLAGLDREHFYLMTFTRRLLAIDSHLLARGGADGVRVYYRDLLKQILNDRASAVVIAHNHPMETSLPGHVDIESMRQLEGLLDAISVDLIDQYVVGEDGVYSCRQRQLIHRPDRTSSTRRQDELRTRDETHPQL